MKKSNNTSAFIYSFQKGPFNLHLQLRQNKQKFSIQNAFDANEFVIVMRN